MQSMHNLRDVPREQTAYRLRASTDRRPRWAHRNTRAVQGAPSLRSTATKGVRGRNGDNTLIKELYGWVSVPHESTPQQKIAPSLSQGGDTDGSFLREADR
jgi:hypothetical protein